MCSIHFPENCVVHKVITVNTAGPEGQNTFSCYCGHSVSWMAEESWCDSLQEQEICLFSTASKQSLCPSIQWVWG